MIRREQNGVILYESGLLNDLKVRHGFFTRHRGVSQGAFESLNVKLNIGDDEQKVLRNRQTVMDTISCKELIFSNDLPHSDELKWIENNTDKDPAIDAMATSVKKLAIGLSTADCVPMIVSDGVIVAVIHAGWRGTVKMVVEKTVLNLVQNGLNLDNTVAALGPSICKKHFAVRDIAAIKLRLLNNEPSSEEIYHADLNALNIQQLRDAGVSRIDTLGVCSAESEDFYSHRRDNGKTGRNMAVALLS